MLQWRTTPSLYSLFKGSDLPKCKLELLLEDGGSFGWMSFLTPPIIWVTVGIELGSNKRKSITLSTELQKITKHNNKTVINAVRKNISRMQIA